MRTTVSVALVVAIAQLAGGCNVLDSGDSRGGTTSPIEGRVLFRVAEGYLDPSVVADPTILLCMETDKIYPCCNYSIRATVQYRSDTVTVDLLDIYKPDICATALGPALHCSALAIATGEYHLAFRSGLAAETYGVSA